MSGRRMYPRFKQTGLAGGVMRVYRDIALQDGAAGSEISVLSDAPGVVGEALTLALAADGPVMELRVKVVESRPHPVGDSMRYRVRLAILSATPEEPAPFGGDPR